MSWKYCYLYFHLVQWKLIGIVWLCNVVGSQKVEKSFRSSYQFISIGVGIKDGPFASNDFWGDVKIRQDRCIAFWSGPLSLAQAILCLLLVLFL